MKKYLSLIAVSLCFITVNLFAIDAYGTGRTNGMGKIGSSGLDTDITYFPNPAAIYFYNQKKKFFFDAYYSDTRVSDGSNLMEYPDMGFKVQFTGTAVALSLGVDKYAQSYVKVDNGRNYNFCQRFDIATSFAYGYKNFSLGAGVYGGSSQRKSDVFIGSNTYFGDFIKNMFFREYSRDLSSEFVNIEIGVMYKMDSFVFSVKSDELLSYIAGNQERLSFENGLQTLGAAVYFSTDSYARRGRLKKLVFNTGFEGKNLFSEKNRTINFGAEWVYQLARDYNLSGRLGYYTDPVDPTNGVFSLGIGTRINKVDISLSAEMPISTFKDGDGGLITGLNIVYVI